MELMKRLEELAGEHGGIVETGIAERNGISRSTLCRLCKAGRLERIAQGQYILPDEWEDEYLSISRRSGNLIFSHETALYLHGISDRVPFENTFTVPTGRSPSVALQKTCKVYYVKPDLFELGRTTVKTHYGHEVPCYDLDRTICDIIRSRNRIGYETFLYAVKAYAVDRRQYLHRLSDYAEKLHVEKLVRQYLEILL